MRDFQQVLDGKFMGELFKLEDSYWWYKGIRHFTALALARTPEFQLLRQKPIIMLDAGCGSGGNMVQLSQYGKIVGLDFLEVSVRRVRARGFANACRGSMLEMPFKNNTFDLVASFDALVCLEEDVKALRNLYDLCRPGGLLVLNVAAFMFLYGSNSVVTGELHRYEQGELRAKLEQVGFKVLKLTYRNFILFPLFVLVRLLKKFQTKPTADMYALPPLLNSCLYGLLKVDSWLGTRFALPFGSAVFCIAQKPK